MRKITLISFLLISFFSLNTYADFYGCDDVVLDYAVDQANKVVETNEQKLRAVAEVEEIYLDDTYGTGEFKVTFVNLSYTVLVNIFSNSNDTEFSCEVNEDDSYKN